MSEASDKAAKKAREQKNRFVADTRTGDDLHPTIDVWRGERFLAGIVCPGVDRDQALSATHLAVPGFGADSVVLTLDARMATEMINPATGEEWGPGEMQELGDPTVAPECLLVHEMARDGSWSLLIQPYNVNKTARTIAWFPDVQEMGSTEEGTGAEGLIMEVLREAYGKPDLLEVATREYPDDLPDDVRLMTDIAVVKMLLGAGYLVAYQPADEREARAVDESLGRWKATEGVMRMVDDLENRRN